MVTMDSPLMPQDGRAHTNITHFQLAVITRFVKRTASRYRYSSPCTVKVSGVWMLEGRMSDCPISWEAPQMNGRNW